VVVLVALYVDMDEPSTMTSTLTRALTLTAAKRYVDI